MPRRDVVLFVMPGCQICPTMERLFTTMLQQGRLSGLEIVDMGEQPERASALNIRAAPYYLINGVGFSGLRSRAEIEAVLQREPRRAWQQRISDELGQGNLADIEQAIRDEPIAREAMLALLGDVDTPLVVRIGLTAIIESVAPSGLLAAHEAAFKSLTDHQDLRLATDAIYCLNLLGTPASIAHLQHIAEHAARPQLRAEAAELLSERQASD